MKDDKSKPGRSLKIALFATSLLSAIFAIGCVWLLWFQSGSQSARTPTDQEDAVQYILEKLKLTDIHNIIFPLGKDVALKQICGS
jgi:hypothetical protein